MTSLTLHDLTREVTATAAVEQDAASQGAIEQAAQADAIDQAHKFNKMLAFKYHHQNKRWWSFFVMCLMSAMIAFQSVLLWKVGAGVWGFTAYPLLVQGMLVTNFAEIGALALVIVKALHDHHKD